MFIIYENKFYKTIIRGGKRYEKELKSLKLCSE